MLHWRLCQVWSGLCVIRWCVRYLYGREKGCLGCYLSWPCYETISGASDADRAYRRYGCRRNHRWRTGCQLLYSWQGDECRLCLFWEWFRYCGWCSKGISGVLRIGCCACLYDDDESYGRGTANNDRNAKGTWIQWAYDHEQIYDLFRAGSSYRMYRRLFCRNVCIPTGNLESISYDVSEY